MIAWSLSGCLKNERIWQSIEPITSAKIIFHLTFSSNYHSRFETPPKIYSVTKRGTGVMEPPREGEYSFNLKWNHSSVFEHWGMKTKQPTIRQWIAKMIILITLAKDIKTKIIIINRSKGNYDILSAIELLIVINLKLAFFLFLYMYDSSCVCVHMSVGKCIIYPIN